MVEIYKDTDKVPSPIIIDIGCSNGNESLRLIEAFPDFFQIYSIDPFYECIDQVKERIKNTPFADKWFYECCAIDNQTGEVEVAYGNAAELNLPSCGLPMPSVGNTPSSSTTNRIVKTKRIQDIHLAPTILKIDIEGYEWFIWEQIFSIESVKVIFLEFHGNSTVNLGEKLEYAKSKGYNAKAYKHTPVSDTKTDPIDLAGYSCSPGNYCQVTFQR